MKIIFEKENFVFTIFYIVLKIIYLIYHNIVITKIEN